ncbi:hypothetical protein OIU85_023094 [Salix viminalis]|uniref:Endonuclease/exonuclease/phosphatase domain-containing protein n=1 Tax=Salix viminalis TaxID=40686 RepID=A0A9Q0U885_SALVM|nr:hypothetical protein OIU85_023094 [Salix viminalis]
MSDSQAPPINLRLLLSWAEKVKVSNANTLLHSEHPPHETQLGATLTIPRDMQMVDVEIWERSMVGFFARATSSPLHGSPFRFGIKGPSMAASMVGKPRPADEATLQGTSLDLQNVTSRKVFGHAVKCKAVREDLNRKEMKWERRRQSSHPHPPIRKQVQSQVWPRKKPPEKGDHEGSDMGDAKKGMLGLLTRSQKGKNIIEEDGENDMIKEDQRDNVGIRTVNKVSSMSSGMGAQEVDRGALNKEASTCSEVEGRRKDNETTRSSLPKDKPQDSEASRSSYSDKPSETEGSWNVRGLNNTRKQQSVRNWINFHNLDLFGLLETRISSINLTSVQANVLPSVYPLLPANGSLVILITSPGLHITGITFVYGCNDHVARSSLWHYLQTESLSNASTPWGIMGDFNSVLCPSDRSGGSSHWQSHHQDFPNCIMQSSLQQIPYTGLHLTWHNNQTGEGTIMKKLDWMFGNQAFFVKWPTIRARFLPREASDHSAMVMNLGTNQARTCGPFKFLNQWVAHDDFLDIVNGAVSPQKPTPI